MITKRQAQTLEAELLECAGRAGDAVAALQDKLTEFMDARGWAALGYTSPLSWFDDRVGNLRFPADVRPRVALMLSAPDTVTKRTPTTRELAARLGVTNATISRDLAGDAATDRRRETIPAAMYREVMESRDGCSYCGDLFGPFQADHVRPVWRGGPTVVENLIKACRSCNTQKGSRSLAEWILYRKSAGYTWPPAATHPVELNHFRSNCRGCRDESPAVWSRGLAITTHARTVHEDHFTAKIAYWCPVNEEHPNWWVLFRVNQDGSQNSFHQDCSCSWCLDAVVEQRAMEAQRFV